MTATYEFIEYEISEEIATISFNRPDKLNAYTPETGEEIVAAFNLAKDDPGVRVVILTGKGRAFCAGVDLDYLKANLAGENISKGPALGQEHLVRDWPLELIAFPKPVIAAINGAAYGVGVTMILGCDVRYASEDAKLGINFAAHGVLPGLGSTHLLPQLVGTAKAMELVLSAATVSASEAERIGLVQKTVPGEQLIAEARDLAKRMIRCRPEVLTATKQALRHGATSTMAEAIAVEREHSLALKRARDAARTS